MQDSNLGGQGGKGTVDPAKMRQTVNDWGRLSPRAELDV